MNIRHATTIDAEQWSQMRTDLWPDTPDHHRREIQAFFAGVSIDVDTLLLIEVDEKVVGFIELNIRNFAEGSQNPQVPYVEGWYIKPDYRNNGYGKALMLAAEQWALAKGFSEIASDTEIDNHQSIAMHQQMGYEETERVVCFLKQLK